MLVGHTEHFDLITACKASHLENTGHCGNHYFLVSHQGPVACVWRCFCLVGRTLYCRESVCAWKQFEQSWIVAEGVGAATGTENETSRFAPGCESEIRVGDDGYAAV